MRDPTAAVALLIALALPSCTDRPPKRLKGSITVHHGQQGLLLDLIDDLKRQFPDLDADKFQKVRAGELAATCPAFADGFDDISSATPVEVRDGSGTTLAVTHLSPGRITGVDDVVVLDAPRVTRSVIRCVHTFEADVPSAKFYRVVVGGRSEFPYSRDQLEAKRWAITMDLGK